jgi:hypothetical protein
MRPYTLLIILLLICGLAKAQLNIPPYTIIKDSATHTTVRHSSDAEIAKVRSLFGQKGIFEMISPDIKVKNGVVDHKGPMGNLDVREYFDNNKLIGYIQYDGLNKEREIYYNKKGDIYLEIRYDKGSQTYKNDSIRKPSALLIPVKVNYGNTGR